MSHRPSLFLLDGYSIAFRAFFALPLLSTRSGRYTNATYGFCMMLSRLLEEHEPELIAVALDKGKPTVRLERYADYKGTRQKTPVEMLEQITYIKEILTAYRIPIIEYEGYEADDIIGTLAKQAEGAGMDTKIVTGDKDALQLVSPSVSVMLMRKGITEVELYDVAAVRQRYGLEPKQLIDLKALMGDSSDNIPGVPGIGEKTGVKLLQAAGSLESLLADPSDFATPRQQNLLAEHRDKALLSRDLAEIVTDLPLPCPVQELKRSEPDYDSLAALLREYELRSLLEKLPQHVKGSTSEELDPGNWLQVESDSEWRDLVSRIQTKSPVTMNCMQLAGGELALALSPQAGQVYVVKVEEHHRDKLHSLLADASFVGHDLKSAIVAFGQAGLPVFRPAGDTLLAAYLLEPSQNDYSLARLSEQYLQLSIHTNGDDELATLAAECAAIWPLRDKLELLLEEKELSYLYRHIELPLSRVLAKMELQGVAVDRQVLLGMQQDMEQRLHQVMAEIYDLAGESFNLNSPRQLGVILFEKLQLPVIKKTKTGYSTDMEVLEALADQHELVSKVLQYRQLSKLNSTYLEGLLQVVAEADGKIHTTYHQTVTTTGRLSSSEPNLQNIPVRLAEGRAIRRAFKPAPDYHLILAADYSQIELRILAHISQDPILIKAFIEDEDIHTRTAAEVFGVASSLVTREMRDKAKAVNFGIVYGISDYGLSRDLKVSRAEAKRYIDSYLARYAGVRRYLEQVIRQAREDGFVTTLLNRRRYLPDINSRNFNQRSFAERTAMNTPIQGSAADLIKLAMVNIDQKLSELGVKSKMILQVHDELIFETTAHEMPLLAMLVQQEMESVLELLVPLKVDLKSGTSWYDVKPYSPRVKEDNGNA